jgi:hypothetical protein
MSTEATPTPAPNRKEILLALKGYVVLQGNKLGFEYIEINELPISGNRTVQKPGRSLCYAKRLIGGESIGSIIKVAVTDDYVSMYKHGRFLTGKRLDDTETATAWAAASEATRLAYEQAKANKKAASVDPLTEALKPIKQAYFETNRAGRVQLLAKVIAIITGA